jgi:ABC-type transport system involved in cytochrome c biogenesis permease subunit
MSSHELNSVLLYIHPSLAILGHILVFALAAVLFILPKRERIHRILALTTWLITFFGLLTGMFWAQVAWGSYWSWDPKETLTLILFGSVSASLISYYEKQIKLAKGIALVSAVFSVITWLSSYIIAGLHSFA